MPCCSAGLSGDAHRQRAVRRGGVGARVSGRVWPGQVGRAAVGDRERGGGHRGPAGRARRVGRARRLAHQELVAAAQVLHRGELHVAHVAGDGKVPVLGELVELGDHVLRVRLDLRGQLDLLLDGVRHGGQGRRDAVRRPALLI